MGYTSDGFATLLLTMALSPNREEYARPYSTQEFYKLEQRVRESSYRSIGALIGVDISGLMMNLNISEEEGYRIFTLLNRGVQLGYSIESFLMRGIEVIPLHNDDYPRCLERRMRRAAPPFLYRTGNVSLIGQPAISIVGISGVKTTPEVRDGIETIVRTDSKQRIGASVNVTLYLFRSFCQIAAGMIIMAGNDPVKVPIKQLSAQFQMFRDIADVTPPITGTVDAIDLQAVSGEESIGAWIPNANTILRVAGQQHCL